MPFLSKSFFPAAFAGLAVILTGCASVSVDDLSASTSKPAQKPDIIYVAPFEYTTAHFYVNRDGDELAAYQKNIQQMLSAALVAEISDEVVPAKIAGPAPTGSNAWLVCGKFVEVDEGDPVLRGTIGLGLGATKLETEVSVYNLSTGQRTPFFTFATTGGSGAQPGAIMGLGSSGAMGAAVSGVSGAARGLTKDTERTSRMISAALSQYMYKQGWITAAETKAPKIVPEPTETHTMP